MTPVLAIESEAQFGVFLAQGAPGVTDGSKGGFASPGSARVAFTECFLHGGEVSEHFRVLFIAIATAPGLIEDGLGTRLVDDSIQCDGCLFEAIGEDCRGLALILQDDEIELTGSDFRNGCFVPEMEGKSFTAGGDETELGLRMWGRLNKLDDCFADASGVTIPYEQNFFRFAFFRSRFLDLAS